MKMTQKIFSFLNGLILTLSLVSAFAIVTVSSRALAQNPGNLDPLHATLKLPYEWSAGQSGQLEIKMELPAGYHAYADSLKIQILEPDGFQFTAPKISPQIEWYDKFSKKNRQGFEKTSTLKTHIEAPGHFIANAHEMKIELTYQACSEQFCLFPTKKLLTTPIKLIGVTVPEIAAAPETVPPPAPTAPPSLFDSSTWGSFLEGNLAWGLLLVFIAGVLTSFTPCIFPMIPITLAVLGNHAQERSRVQNFLLSVVYVLGIATTYSVLGLIAASSGNLFGSGLGNSYVLILMCAIFLSMALSMYGLYELQVPAFIRNRFGGSSKTKGGFGGAYVTGLFAGIVASPCVGPVLVSILTFVATSHSQFLGFAYLFTYAFGLGMIFIALGLSNQLFQRLPRSGMWMNAFKFFLGTLMLSAFYYYLNLLLPDRYYDIALGTGLVILGSVYGAFLKAAGQKAIVRLQKGVMLAALLIGIGYLGLGVFDLRPALHHRMISDASINQLHNLDWKPYSDEALAQAARDKKPVIVDFWAEWCAACHEMEEQTFTQDQVKAIAGNFVLLKFDATSTTPLLKELKARYRIQGLPTILFFNREGSWLESLTLTEFEKAPGFVGRMEKALK